MLDAVNLHLAARGIRIETGTIVDATIIHAPSSTKNENKERDPAMRQTCKGKQWHSVATSAANASTPMCAFSPKYLVQPAYGASAQAVDLTMSVSDSWMKRVIDGWTGRITGNIPRTSRTSPYPFFQPPTGVGPACTRAEP